MYEVKILDASRTLTAIDQLNFEDTSDMGMLSDFENNAIIENITGYVYMSVHNDRLEEPDYTVFIVETEDGCYYTSSNSFKESFVHIWQVVQEEADTEEVKPVSVKIKRIPSRNYKGNDILSCKYVG